MALTPAMPGWRPSAGKRFKDLDGIPGNRHRRHGTAEVGDTGPPAGIGSDDAIGKPAQRDRRGIRPKSNDRIVELSPLKLGRTVIKDEPS